MNIIRSEECLSFLKKVNCEEKSYFNQNYWLFNSEESFHGVLLKDSFKFEDARLPDFEIPLEYVKVEN